MERLGENEIFTIFEQIPNPEDKKSFALVCKIFLKVACSHLRSLNTQFPDFLYDMLIASPKMVSFTCRESLSNNQLKLIAESCPNIETLCLSSLKYLDHEEGKLEFDDVGLCAIANACIHLILVILNGRLRFKEIGIGSLVRSCKHLRILSLNYCVNVTDKSLKMIGEATRLGLLALTGCYLISDLGLEYLADGDLKYCLFTLYLNKCDRITDNGIVHLQKLVSLTTVGLSRCGVNITDYGVVALCELPNIATLYLDYLVNLTDISLRGIGSKCLEVRTLHLDGCERITDVGLRAFYGHQKLTVLSLVSCYKLSWEDIKPIVMSCPNIRCLNLSRSMKKPKPEARHEYFDTDTHRCQIYWE